MLKFDSILFDGCKNLLFKSKVTAALTWTWLTFNKVDFMMSWSLNDLITMLSFSLQDQFDNLEKHTQWGIEYLEKYTKFVKERSEIEINYAKQIRWVVKMTCDPYCGLQGLLFGGGVFHPGSIKYAASTVLTDWRVLETLKEDHYVPECDFWPRSGGQTKMGIYSMESSAHVLFRKPLLY